MASHLHPVRDGQLVVLEDPKPLPHLHQQAPLSDDAIERLNSPVNKRLQT